MDVEGLPPDGTEPKVGAGSRDRRVAEPARILRAFVRDKPTCSEVRADDGMDLLPRPRVERLGQREDDAAAPGLRCITER
jgi:hypothetical protein